MLKFEEIKRSITQSSLPTPTIAPPATGEDCRFRLTRFDTQLRIEFDLIGHRMTWLVISQSFLFSAFATALRSIEDEGTRHAVKVLRRLVPELGILSALLAGVAIIAAHMVILRLKRRRDQLEEIAEKEFNYERLGVGSSTWPHWLGNAASVVLPWLLIVVWARLLNALH